MLLSDNCVLQGSTYAFPCRPAEGDKTVEDVRKTLLAFQADVAASSAILVAGGKNSIPSFPPIPSNMGITSSGGPTGIEFAAEVAEFYAGSGKSVTVSYLTSQSLHSTFLLTPHNSSSFTLKINTSPLDSTNESERKCSLSSICWESLVFLVPKLSSTGDSRRVGSRSKV